MNFRVSNLGWSDLFLGHDWLKHHNPEINWETKIIKFTCCPGSCQKGEIGEEPEDEEPMEIEGDHLLIVEIGEEELTMQTKTTLSMEIASVNKDTWTIEEILPRYCHPY